MCVCVSSADRRDERIIVNGGERRKTMNEHRNLPVYTGSAAPCVIRVNNLFGSTR